MSSKPKFDPSQPFEVAGKPKFDPNAEFSVVDDAPSVSKLDSAGRGLAQGISFNLRDEAAGALKSPSGALKELANKFGADFSDEDIENYRQERDASRALDEEARKANPKSYMAGEMGGAVGTALIPGLNVAKGAQLGTVAGKAALQGAAYGLGSSEGESIKDIALDTAKGAGMGAGAGALGYGIGKALTPVGKFINEKSKKVLPKLGSWASGVDEDALARQMNRPTQVAEMEADDAVYNLGKQGLREIESKGRELGEGVKAARDGLIDARGSDKIGKTDIQEILAKGKDFLERHSPSKKGYSAITQAQGEELNGLLKNIKSGNIEDFIKIREHLDQVEALASKYGKDSLTAYERELMSLRGQINDVLKRADGAFKGANEAFSNYAEQKGALGLNSETRAESVFNNLFGANKTAKQNAAEQLLNPETFEKAQDIAANKAFREVGPAGSEWGLRNMLKIAVPAVGAVPTGGAAAVYPLLTSPAVWKQTMRSMGKFGPALEKAAQKSPEALAATFSVLSKDPEFRKLLLNSK